MLIPVTFLVPEPGDDVRICVKLAQCVASGAGMAGERQEPRPFGRTGKDFGRGKIALQLDANHFATAPGPENGRGEVRI